MFLCRKVRKPYIEILCPISLGPPAHFWYFDSLFPRYEIDYDSSSDDRGNKTETDLEP